MASASGPLPWLRFNNIEVGNAARVMEYLRGHVGPHAGSFEIADEYPCSILYTLAGVTDPEDFVDVSTDPAPWYDTTDVRSTYFLGFIPQSIVGTKRSMVARSAGARFGGIEGGKLGPQHRNFRTITVRGILLGNGSAGLDYGMLWLADVLAASNCEQCERGTLEVYNACPDGLSSDTGHYTMYDVGLVEGPIPTGDEANLGNACDVLEVEFTLIAENPWLYSPAAVCLAEEVVGTDEECTDPTEFFVTGDPGDGHCCEVAPPSIGVKGSIITIDAPSGIGGVECGYFESCEPGPEDVPSKAIYIERLDMGQKLVIDSSRKRVILIETIPAVPGSLCGGDPCTDTVVERDGISTLHFAEGRAIEWLDIASCDTVDGCFCVRTTHPCSGGADATVKIEVQHRV